MPKGASARDAMMDPILHGIRTGDGVDVSGGSAEAGPLGGGTEPAWHRLDLSLSDLIQDANGEVVVFNDSNLRNLALSTDASVIAEGSASSHVTAAGEDVSGFKFVTFDNGMTLYYEPHLEVTVRHEHG